MDKLEHYLDQVCRGIAGPRSLRQHIRQELKEHLTDAAAEHESAGMAHEEAIDRAIEEFGGPDEVRHELEAAHGRRLMSLVVDKAMQWKENTMKAKWLWSTWAHLTLVLVIGLEVLFVACTVTFVMPRFMSFYDRGWLGTSENHPAVEKWAYDFFGLLLGVMSDWLVCVIPLALLWVLFEWRVRSENKTMIRLAMLGSAAVMLLVVTLALAALMILPLSAEMPIVARRDQEADIRRYVSDLDAALPALETWMEAKDWTNVRSSLFRVSQAVWGLSGTGSSAPVLISMREPEKTQALRTQLSELSRAMTKAQSAVYDRDTAVVEDAMHQARAVLDQIRPTTQSGQ